MTKSTAPHCGKEKVEGCFLRSFVLNGVAQDLGADFGANALPSFITAAEITRT